MPLEVELPSTEERDDLLDALARLRSAAGAVPLLTEPVMPTQRWFPDAWNGKESGLELLLRRLLDHAGLRNVGVELDIAAAPRSGLEDAPPGS